MQSTVPDLSTIAHLVVHALMLLGLVGIIVRPFFPGVGVIAVAVLAHVGVQLGLNPQIDLRGALALAGFVFFSFAGQFSGWWSERLGMRFTYVTPEVMWGGFLGLILVSILNLSLFWQIIALFIGATVAAMGVQKRPFKDAIAHGPLAIYWMLGPRGFALLMALLVSDMAMRWLLRPIPALMLAPGVH